MGMRTSGAAAAAAHWVTVLLLLAACHVTIFPRLGEGLYVTSVPGVVPVHRGSSAYMRWTLDVPVADARPVRLLDSRGLELVSSYWGAMQRRIDHGEVASRMELLLSPDRRDIKVLFVDAQDSDDGLYTLAIAAADDDGVRSPGRLLVYYGPEWRGGRDTQTIRARPGDKNVTLNCSVAANPAATFSWDYAVGWGPTPGRRRSLISHSSFSWHIIDEVTPEDFGVYTCTASNVVQGNQDDEILQFTSVFNVTLVERGLTNMADVAVVLLPILIVIAVILLIICCLRQRCVGRCRRSKTPRQKKAVACNEPALDEGVDVPLNDMQLDPSQTPNGIDRDYQMLSDFYLGNDQSPYAQPVPVPLPLPPEPLSTVAEEEGVVSEDDDEDEETMQKMPIRQLSDPTPEPVYAAVRPRHLNQPVRPAPGVPVRSVTLPPVRVAPQPPAQADTSSPHGSTKSVPSSSTSRTLPTNSHPPSTAPRPIVPLMSQRSNGRKTNVYRPVNFTDPEGPDSVQPPVRGGGLLPESSSSRSDGLQPSASSSVCGSGGRRHSGSLSSNEDLATQDQTLPDVPSTSVNGVKHNNNNNYNSLPPPPPDVIYADVMVHASMEEDREKMNSKVIGAKTEPSDYISIDFKRMRSS